MTDRKKIFVGSSGEALKAAELVKEVIDDKAGMEGVLWNKDVFQLGMTLLETIESLPFEYHGAVFLWTPDLFCTRRKDTSSEESFGAPVANVVFEYGYLAARLTRKRVAICRFEEADIPSDLQGLTVVSAGSYNEGDLSELPGETKSGLCRWLERLPTLADEMPPVSQAHGYSGTWNVKNRFSLWRGCELEESDKVHFDGKTFLVLQPDGASGSGIQIGKLYVKLGEYRATYEIVNSVLAASVDENGILRMRVKVVRREGPKNVEGERPERCFEEGLANTEFDLTLEPVPGESKRLQGTHVYQSAMVDFQKAHERYEYSGLFGPSCL